MNGGSIIFVLAGAVGACAGSFIVTAGMRAARSEPFLKGRSHCDGCGVTLTFVRTVPLVSYIGARGRCAACGAAIDPLHPMAELAGALIATLPILAATPVRAPLLIATGFCLLASSVVDLRTRRLPDALTVLVAILSAILAFERGALWSGLFSGGVAFVLLEAVRRGYQRARGTAGIGFGDVKLVGALAIWLQERSPWVIVLASILGLALFAIRRPRDGRLAFGPAIAVAAFAVGLLTEAGLLGSAD